MKNTPIFPAEWLDVISCCGAKTQLSIISAIVKYQADGTVPDFKGLKLALFRALARHVGDVPATQADSPEKKKAPKGKEKDKKKPSPRIEDKATGVEAKDLDPKQEDAVAILLEDFNGRDRLADSLEYFPIPRDVFNHELICAIHKNCPSDETMINEDLFWKYIYDLARQVVEKYMASLEPGG